MPAVKLLGESKPSLFASTLSFWARWCECPIRQRHQLGDSILAELREEREIALLGRIFVHLKRYKNAEPLLREALTIRRMRRNFPGDWKTAKTESVLGACLTGLGKYGEAEPYLLRGYPIIAKDKGSDHRRTIEAIQRVINLYEAWNKPDKAAKYRAILHEATLRHSQD